MNALWPEYLIVQFASVGGPLINIGVIAIDPTHDEMYIRMREDWTGFNDDDIEILSDLAGDLRIKAHEVGPSHLLAYLEGTLSNAVRISDRQPVPGGRVDEGVLEILFQREVLSG